jgi:hypothetical protein
MVEIISVVLVILAVLLGSYTSRSRRAEPDVLADLGFTSFLQWERKNIVESPNALQFYESGNFLKSESHPELTIFSTMFNPTGMSHRSRTQYNTRIFAFKPVNGRFPKFMLSPEKIDIGIKIRYEDHQEFSNIFALCIFDNSDNVKLVRDLFDNTLIHDDIFKNMKQICSDYITIESDGNHIFYYWKYHLFYAQNFPKIISELTTFHKTYFDSTLD